MMPQADVESAIVYDTKIFEVFANSDSTEGRGRTICIGIFTNRENAEARARGQGVMGTNADVKSSTAKVVHFSGEIYLLGRNVEKSFDPTEELRQRALSKLTPEEKKVLGL